MIKRMTLLSMVGVAALGVCALAQQASDAPKPQAAIAKAQPPSAAWFTCSMHPAVRKAAAGKCPKCEMPLIKMTPGPTTPAKGMMAGCMAMMGKAGMDPAMMKRMQVMKQTPIYLDSPCAIYGQAATLELSDEQKAKLIEIENEARKKALAVLTGEQRKKMGDIPDKPMAMKQMCAKMKPMMQKKMGKKGGATMMCPMMQGKGEATGGSKKGSGPGASGCGKGDD